MRAVVITQPGDTSVLAIRELPNPALPGGDQVLVRVQAAGVNRADILQRRGQYPPPPGAPKQIPGLEFAGEIEAVGPLVLGWKPGRRVMGIVSGGAQAEYVLVQEGAIAEIPDSMGWAEAAAIPEVFITAHDALFTQMGLQLGESVLIHAAASGVGTAAVQLAHAAGCLVFGTSRSAEKIDAVRALGLDEAIIVPPKNPDIFSEQIREATGGLGVNAIMDLVGAPYLSGNLEALAPLGRLILVGMTAGSTADIDLSILLHKRLRVFGTVLRARSAAEKAAAVRRFSDQVLPLIRCGILKPIIDTTFALGDIVEAHKRIESNATFGKVVLTF